MDEPVTDVAEVVERLWREVRLRDQARPSAEVPEVAVGPPLVDDPELRRLNASWDTDRAGASPAPDAALVAFVNTVARRHDELAAEVRLLRDALHREAERLAERADTLHRLVEVRVERLEADQGGKDPDDLAGSSHERGLS